MNKELQKNEAIERMKMLEIYPATIREFERDNIINKSEHGGILYWLDENEQEMVKKFEEKHNAVVYHVIHNYTGFGELYSLLYVSENETEWGYDRDDLRHNVALVYVKNIEDDFCSEFGSIGIKKQFGGLARTC
ncbi:MAG: hypothetical protein PHQ62_00050 [Clostridia bacterium]|nr:hypothetical protein [Clostridia bacterium]